MKRGWNFQERIIDDLIFIEVNTFKRLCVKEEFIHFYKKR